MSHTYKTHKSPLRFDGKTSPAPHPVSRTPLGDDRYQSLLAKANAFFAEAERDVVAERSAVITEIRERMAEYGLRVEDLLDSDCESPRVSRRPIGLS